jgi:DNA-binding transcriptional ArsR family regulator
MARKAAKLPDWIFSAPNKRRVIAYVLAARNSGKVIGEREVARALGVDPRGSVDEHLFALAQLGLLERREGPRRFKILEPAQHTPLARELSDALGALLEALEQVEEVPVDRP